MCELDGKVAGMPEAGNRHHEVRALVDPAPSVVGDVAAAVDGSVVFGHAVPRPRCQAAARRDTVLSHRVWVEPVD